MSYSPLFKTMMTMKVAVCDNEGSSVRVKPVTKNTRVRATNRTRFETIHETHRHIFYYNRYRSRRFQIVVLNKSSNVLSTTGPGPGTLPKMKSI